MPEPTPAPRELSLSVFFPCHNESDNIIPLITRTVSLLEDLVREWEIIIVDDGSTDGTAQLADALTRDDPRIRVVHHERNMGYGMALRSGFASATKDYVFYTDGDGQFDITELPGLLERIANADIVSGFRRRRCEGLLRRINAACWGWLVQRVLKFRCRDVDSAFKLYRREIFDRIELKSTGALIDAEVLCRAVRLGYRIQTVGVSHLPRTSGQSSGARIGVIFRAFKELMRLRRDILQGPDKSQQQM